MSIRCFWLEPTQREAQALRRYANASCQAVPGGCHDARTPIGTAPAIRNEKGFHIEVPRATWPPRADLLWPTRCACGYEFKASDAWQLFSELLYVRTDTREEHTLRSAPPGAMWDAWWYREGGHKGGYLGAGPGPDGRCLMVKTPGGEWYVDGRASNCTMPNDDVHRCWVRRGEVPNITVDKAGDTCGAGGGSIQAGSYHGFLTNGELT